MKNTLLLFAALFFAAQSPSHSATLPPSHSASDDALRDSHPCRIVIKGSYETTCPYIVDKIDYDEYTNTLVACKGSRVTYTAYSYLGTATAASYTWSIIGDASHTASGDEVVVDWGTDDWGWLSVMVVSSAGDTCYEEARVSLIDKPTAASTTIPSYTLLPGGTKVVYVCYGSDITFIDQSTANGSDIAGWLWKASSSSAETPNFTLENVTSNTVVTHRVTNSCGCYDIERYKVEVITGTPLELDCYGTVCEGDRVTYKIVSPGSCREYVWHVEGGTLIDGQYTPTPTVVWDHPQDGYGTLGIDGWRCSSSACQQVMSVKIPVIQDALTISGQQEVCVGEAVQFSLPLFGSTAYQWSISPATGITIDNTLANTLNVRFSQPGTYTLHCTYRCDFLDCGPYEAEPLTIVVKPRLEIEGWDQVCLGNACALQTAPNVSATWKAYDLGSGSSTPVATATGTSFSHTFAATGRYLVTAEHPSYCSPATFTLTVQAPPPAPTALDLDPSNRHTACLYGGIALSGSPSLPQYSLVWEPTCPTASPQLHSGDSVAIGFQGEVCDVRVYNYDRRLQCRSSDYYVHTVTPLMPDSVLIPSTITVCPGTVITWGTDVVPDQRAEGMLYEWTIESTKQYCASVQGSHLEPGVTLVVNKISTPTTFYVRLRRSFCGGFVDKFIHFNVEGSLSGPLSINGPDTVCMGTPAHFTGSGGHSNTYRWYAESTVASSVAFDHVFENSGVQTVRLTSCEHDYCTNPDYLLTAQHTVHVYELPMVQGLQYNSSTHVLSVVPALSTTDYTFDWFITADGSGAAQSFQGSNTVNVTYPGTYYCTVTDRTSGCSRMVSLYVPMQNLQLCDDPSVTMGSFDYCSSSIPFQVNNTSIIGNVHWTVSGGAYTTETSGTHNRNATITVGDIGIYRVNITFSSVDECYEETQYFTVDFLPSFSFEAACDRVVIHNNSRYADPAQNIQLQVYNSCSGSTQTITFPASQRTYTYTPFPAPMGECTYSFSLYQYGNTLVDQPCSQGQAAIGVPAVFLGANPVSITLENPYSSTKTCDNTPIELVASLNYSPATIVSSSWTFGDNSQYDTTGNRIHHTFAYSGSLEYNVYTTITNNHGCQRSSTLPLQISSSSNPLISGMLSQDGTNQCPYVGTIDLTYNTHNPINHYTWESNPPTSFNTYATHHNGSYHLLVVNDNYCHRELAKDVFFLNAPSAFIFAEDYTCCQGEEIVLYGDAGPSENNDLTYLWTIANSSGTTVQTGTTPTFRFSSSTPGTYTATLTVSNGLCSATAHATLTVQTPPPAPTLAFGSPSCIGNAPVELLASGYTGTVHWSNGDTGPTANYYAPGLVKAYYFDPTIGCRSDINTLHIAAQPDFDALLTGCYERCKYLFPTSLPLYSFPNDNIDWEWYMHGSLLTSGTAIGNNPPIMLPLPGPDTYQMELNYGVGCHETSPVLDIKDATDCECDSLTVTYDKAWQSTVCPLRMKYKVIICNNSSDSACIGNLLPDPMQNNDFHLLSTSFTACTLAPNDCVSFDVTIEVHSLQPAVACFSIYDSCNNCTKTFTIVLEPEVGCTIQTDGRYHINQGFSSATAVYLDFSLVGISGLNALACWSEPPAVIDWYNTSTGVTGLGMIDMATLTQLAVLGEKICFHILYCADKLCDWVYCTDAAALYNQLQQPGTVSQTNEETDMMAPPSITPTGDLRLMPNPTTGGVAVEGANGQVEEVKVMDMHGRQMARFFDTGRFDISHLATGVYIVRVVTRNSEGNTNVHYLKLTKK